MKKQKTQLWSAVSALLVLSGCSFSGNAVPPQKTPEVPVVPAANKQESDEQEYINLAELLFENRDGIAAFEIFKEYAEKEIRKRRPGWAAVICRKSERLQT